MCRHLAGSKKIIFIRMSWRRRMKERLFWPDGSTGCSTSSPGVPFVMRWKNRDPRRWPKGSRPLGTRLGVCYGVWRRNHCVSEAKCYVVSSPDIIFFSRLKTRNTVSRETSLAVAGLYSASVISNILLDFWKVIKRSFAKLLIRKVFCTLP